VETWLYIQPHVVFPRRLPHAEFISGHYQSTPLTVSEIPPNVFSLAGAGGTVTSVGSSQGSAVIDTGYVPRASEIRSAIASALHQSPLAHQHTLAFRPCGWKLDVLQMKEQRSSPMRTAEKATNTVAAG